MGTFATEYLREDVAFHLNGRSSWEVNILKRESNTIFS
jgi:hypothetical protein